MLESAGKHDGVVYLARIYTPLSSGGWADITSGALAVSSRGRIEAVGEKEGVLGRFRDYRAEDYSSCLLAPGFVDCHQHLCHYDWVRLIPDLMKWLGHIYELELRFEDLDYASETAKRFFTDLARNGTTTCCVHGSYFPTATEAAFQAAAEAGLRILMGMNAGDTNLPAPLCRPAKMSIEDAIQMHAKWDQAGDGLLSYCFTVRPAYCASEELLRTVAEVARHLKARVQCHLAEDREGQKRIVELFPNCLSDSEVYHEVGLLGPHSIMAHGVYLSETDYSLLSEDRVAIAHCPRANLMAGGEQMDMARMRRFNLRTGLGTDLGGSKGLSMFRAMEDALKVTPSLSVHDAVRLATLDGAAVLSVNDRIGSLETGKDADFLLLSPKMIEGKSDIPFLEIDDALSSLVFRGDDRDVKGVYVRGKRIDGCAN